MNVSPFTTARRSRLLLGLLAFASLPLVLHAQGTPAPSTGDDVIALEEYRVSTGSNISRPVAEEGALPITVLDFNQLEAIDATNAVELFESLSVAGFSNINESNSLGADARGDVSSINLRGIGSGNSLILLNGRRITPHPISQAENRVPALSVNINTLPTTIVERIEVLRDGASAVYGADAAAGVLNTITRSDYNRTQATVRRQFTEAGGGDEWRVTLSHGETLNGGKTHLAFSYDHWRREALFTRDREFSKNADNRQFAPAPWDGASYSYSNPDTGGGTSTYTDNDWDNRSSSSYYGQWRVGSWAGDQFVPARPATGIATNTTGTSATTSNPQMQVSSAAATLGQWQMVPTALGTRFQGGQATPTRLATNPINDYYYNLNEFRGLLPEVNRHSLFGTWTHRFDNGIQAFGDMLAYFSKSTIFRDPISADSTDDPGIYVPASNPFNPFGVRFYHPTGQANADGTPRNTGTPLDVLIAPGTGVRFRDWGARQIDVESRSFRFLTGLRGRVFDTWDWESALNFSSAKTRDTEQNGLRESKLREAMARTDPATAFNPFGYTFKLDQVATTGTNQYRIVIDQDYTNPQSVLDEIASPFVRIGHTSLFTADLKTNGELLNLPAGPLRAAAGVEYRYETYEDWRPPFAGINPEEAVAARPDLFRPNDNDFIALSPNANIDRSRNVFSGFSEVLIPIFRPSQNIPFIHSLELSIAGRYERFSLFGDTFVPKVGIAYRPWSWALLRASYNESFRAPNLVQTNPDPIQRSVSSITDWYRSITPQDSSTRIFPDSASRSRTVFRGGNELLRPETTETIILGAVVDVPFIQGLRLSADFFSMRQKDVIDAPTGTRQTRLDDDMLQAALRAQLAAGVAPANLSAYDANGNYLGNPYIVRFAPNQNDIDGYAGYNQEIIDNNLPNELLRAPVGAINYLVNDYLNLAGRELSGLDFAVDWQLPATKLGRFRIRGEATYVTKFKEKLDETVEETDERWKDNNPKWRGNLALTWRITGRISTGVSAFYYGSSLETSSVMGTTTMTQENLLARYQALGEPKWIVPTLIPGGIIRYYYKNPSWYTFNTYVRYSFAQREGLLQGVHLRFGILNFTDEQPPATDLTRGYRGGTSLARGRTFNIEIGKRF